MVLTRALTLTISLQFGADPVLFAWCALRVIEVLNTVELDCPTTRIRMGSNLWPQKISIKLGRKIRRQLTLTIRTSVSGIREVVVSRGSSVFVSTKWPR